MLCQPCHASLEAPSVKGGVRHGAFEQAKALADPGVAARVTPKKKSREKLLNQFPLVFGAICALAMLMLGGLWAIVQQPHETKTSPKTMSTPGLFSTPPNLGTAGTVPPPADLMPAPTSLVPAPAVAAAPAENHVIPAPVLTSSPETATPVEAAEEVPVQAKEHRADHAAGPTADTAASKPQPKPARPARKSSTPRQNKAPKKSLDWIEELRWLS
jgi:cytoskeletal protein RodZ